MGMTARPQANRNVVFRKEIAGLLVDLKGFVRAAAVGPSVGLRQRYTEPQDLQHDGIFYIIYKAGSVKAGEVLNVVGPERSVERKIGGERSGALDASS